MIIKADFEQGIIKKDVGRVYLDPVTELAWIPIPKCGSNSMMTIMKKLNNGKPWPMRNTLIEPEWNKFKRLIILRDPVTRWRAGMGETLMIVDRHGGTMHTVRNYTHTHNMYSGLTNRHIATQISLCHGVDTDNAIFIKLEDFNEKIGLFFPLKFPVPHIRRWQDNEKKKDIITFVDQMLAKEETLEKIHEAYKQDFELIDYLERNNRFV